MTTFPTLLMHRATARPHPAPRPEHRRAAVDPSPCRDTEEQRLKNVACRTEATEARLRRIGCRND